MLVKGPHTCVPSNYIKLLPTKYWLQSLPFYLFIYSLIYLFICLFIYLSIYLFLLFVIFPSFSLIKLLSRSSRSQHVWNLVTHICLIQIKASCLFRCQVISCRTIAEYLSIKPLGTNFSEFLTKAHFFIQENAYTEIVCNCIIDVIWAIWLFVQQLVKIKFKLDVTYYTPFSEDNPPVTDGFPSKRPR